MGNTPIRIYIMRPTLTTKNDKPWQKQAPHRYYQNYAMDKGNKSTHPVSHLISSKIIPIIHKLISITGENVQKNDEKITWTRLLTMNPF